MLKLYSSLAKQLDWNRAKIDKFALQAPKKYKVYTIPKRTRGHRVIAHPARQLKVIQRAMVTLLVDCLPVHQKAFAYKKDVSVRDNAKVHQKSTYLLKMDFSDFFNSITPELFLRQSQLLGIEFSEAEARLLTQLLFYNRTKSHDGKLVLSIGAPSSPLISNFVMYRFDQMISLYCENKGINYSRYADDITFSTNHKNILFSVSDRVSSLLNELYGGQIMLNPLKTKYSSKQHNRHVTGVTITIEGKLSIGRERKRMLSSMIHQFSIGQLDEDDCAYLQGMLAYSDSIEPIFTLRMRNKYGGALIDAIKSWQHE